MASFLRFGVSRLIKRKDKLLPNNMECLLMVPTRGILSKTLREQLPKPTMKKPKPWPYKSRKLMWYNIFERTTHRFDENTKVVVVEGPVAAGKSKVAKELAEQLDMYYLPEANQDMIYTNAYGYNLKKMDDQIPEACRSFDIKDFLANPRHRLAGSFQLRQFYVRYYQYLDALAHLHNTGQGVVLDRCFWSDFVFLETMYKHGYLSEGTRSVYYDMRRESLTDMQRPHVVIYLDVPVNIVEERIKKRKYSCEMQSTVLTPSYLQTMEEFYKQQYLKQISSHAELLVYDWSEEADVEVIVEDIERIDFTNYPKESGKMVDWIDKDEYEHTRSRRYYSHNKEQYLNQLEIARFDVPELVTGAEDMRLYYMAMDNVPGVKYMEGFNKNMGDKDFSSKDSNGLAALPLLERKLD